MIPITNPTIRTNGRARGGLGMRCVEREQPWAARAGLHVEGGREQWLHLEPEVAGQFHKQ